MQLHHRDKQANREHYRHVGRKCQLFSCKCPAILWDNNNNNFYLIIYQFCTVLRYVLQYKFS